MSFSIPCSHSIAANYYGDLLMSPPPAISRHLLFLVHMMKWTWLVLMISKFRFLSMIPRHAAGSWDVYASTTDITPVSRNWIALVVVLFTSFAFVQFSSVLVRRVSCQFMISSSSGSNCRYMFEKKDY